MSHPRVASLAALLAALTLTACASAVAPAADDATPASGAADAAPAEASWPPPIVFPEDMPPADAAGQARADAWLASLPLPAGAVPIDDDLPAIVAQSTQAWWCSPMGIATGTWSVPGATIVDTVNWLIANPPDGLASSRSPLAASDGDVDAASTGFVPAPDALEGMGVTVAASDDGVVIRAEVGAFGDTTVCPTPPPGTALGGPGQG